MEYDKFIDELISLLTSWGTWKEPIKIMYAGKIYAPCQIPEGAFGKICKFEEHNQSLKIYEADMKRSNKDLPDKCAIYIEFNGPLNNLFAFGVLEADLSDLPLSRKMEA